MLAKCLVSQTEYGRLPRASNPAARAPLKVSAWLLLLAFVFSLLHSKRAKEDFERLTAF